MESHERRVESQVHSEPMLDRAGVRVLHHDQRADVHKHAEPEPPESVPGEPDAERHSLHGAGDAELGGLRGRGSQGPGAGGRHDGVEDDRAEQHTGHTDYVRRVVERPAPQAQAVHVDADRGRIDHQPRPVGLHVLLLRAVRECRRAGGVLTDGHDRRLDDYGLGRVQLHRRRVFGEFKLQSD